MNDIERTARRAQEKAARAAEKAASKAAEASKAAAARAAEASKAAGAASHGGKTVPGGANAGSRHSRTPPEPGRVRYSIARRLSSHLFFRTLGLFLSMDILICLIAGGALLAYSEGAASEAALLESFSAYIGGQDTPAAAGVTASVVSEVPRGFTPMAPITLLLPDATEGCLRNAELTAESGAPFLQRLDGLRYNVFYQKDHYTVKISVFLGTFMHYFRYALAILMVFQLISLFSHIGEDGRTIRRTLDPISELAEAAKALNRVQGQLDPDKMAAIAGKLEGINASRLDTRIQVDETQMELKNLAMAINAMLDRINASYRAQVRFVSDASHELRTPISVIQGYANLLDRWGKNDEKTLQESITAIKDEAANMKDLVEQLLFLARGDNNTIPLQPETVDLAELAAEVVSETRMIDISHEFSLKTEALSVSADRGLVKQALRILTDNAIKYTDAGGHITLSVESAGGFARLSVTDDGIGISPELVPLIFDRFYRADESRARATGGAGLGLSIAKWIATRHGGHMEVLSREGIGTKILLALPLPEESAPPPEAAPPA